MSSPTDRFFAAPVPAWAEPVDPQLFLPQHLTPAVQAIKQQLGAAEILDKHNAPWRPRLSATQIDWYTSCPRKWAWAYIAKIKGPPNKWAALGKQVHDVLETWLRFGTPPDRQTEIGQIALAGIKHLPSPGKCKVEGRFEWDLPEEPFDLVGVLDWEDTQDGLPRIGDHKTTGDWKWMKTPEILREDLQATIYSKRTLIKTGAREVLGRWVYYLTRRPYGSRPVDFRSSIDQVEASFDKILVAGRAMAEWHRCKAKAVDLPTDAKACDAYGGCFYRDKCNLSSRERLVSLMSQESLKEKLARKKAELAAAKVAGAGAIAPTAPAAPPPVEAPPPPVAEHSQAAINPPEGQGGPRVVIPSTRTTGAAPGATLKEKMAARRRAPSAPALDVTAAESVPLAASSAAPAPVASAAAVAEPSAAPVAQSQSQGPAFSSPPPAAAPASLPGPAVNVPPAVEAELAAMATTAPPPPASVPAKVEAEIAARSAAAPPPAAVEEPAAPSWNGGHQIKALLVDCAPLQGDLLRVIHLTTLLQGAQGGQVEHLGAYIDKVRLPDNLAVTMSLRTPEGQQAFDLLAERAALVIRGF